jgi:Fe-S cluster biogenesis protein NfuA
VADLGDLLGRLEALLAELEESDSLPRADVFELLDGVDALHRLALSSLGAALGSEAVEQLRSADPVIGWLFEAYGVGVDDHAVASAAVESIRPYIQSHGGSVEVLGVERGVVRLRMSGACSGCTSAAVTLHEGIEEALREGFPGYAGMEVEEDSAASHPPPAPLLQITPRPT